MPMHSALPHPFLPPSKSLRSRLVVTPRWFYATGVLAAALPSVLSTQWGLQHAVEVLNAKLQPPGRVEVAGAQLSWLGGNELQCVKVYDSPRGGQILLHLNKVSTSSSLWHLLTGSGSYNVVICKPWINAIYDARISDFKLVHFLEKVGFLRAPEPLSAGEQQQQQTDHPHHQQQQMLQDGWDKPGAAGPQGQPAQDRQKQKQQKHSGKLIEALGRVNSKMEMNADLRIGRMNLVVTDGLLLVPEEVRQILGPGLHVSGAIGDQELRQWAEEVGEDISWAARSAASSIGVEGGAAAISGGQVPPPPLPPPAEVVQRPGQYKPGLLQVHSDHLSGEMRIWDAADHSLLHQPATASLDLTPALSRLALGATNPVLGNVVEVRGGGRLRGTFNADGGRLPYQAATVEMEPVSLELGASAMALKLLGDLGLPDRALAAASSAATAPVTTTTATPRSPADGTDAIDADRAGPLRAVEVSRMRVHFHRNGQVRTERVDMRLGGGGNGGGGVHLVTWGSANLQRDELDFTLGVSPAPLLAALGLTAEALPSEYLLLVPVRGAVSEPRYDVAAAAVRLAQLGARQRAVQWAKQRAAGDGGGQGRLGALVSGLEALVGAARGPQELLAAIDKVIKVDMAGVPPPLPTAVGASGGG
ncbi:hypothetical protein Vretimale_5407 [Volvox reticuliferus]|uniref:Uncharacterized protein n=1 Tax=Volvox reticuliferus TaxID=1737510 RepID=A0A8J4C2W3_9CHLO|nr:hypothetical protein Vretifemale_3822 [Volvox reticuliferus]GIM00274.1 hypothetical protein Vretimale_5407 [Volvox reticuliferus]